LAETHPEFGTATRLETRALALHGAEFGAAGPDLILIHGIGSRGVSWRPVIDRLAQFFHLIVPDLRGHGASAKPSAGYLAPDYAADLDALVVAFDLRRPLILGHSLGGMVAWRWASEHPDSAARIVIEDAPLHGGSSSLAMFDDWIELASLTPERAAARYQRDHPDWAPADCARRAESITSTSPAVFAEMRALQASHGDEDEDRFGPIAKIQTPMLLIYGDESAGGMVTPAEATRFQQIARHGSLVRIEGGSHALHRDFTEQFLAAAVPFLKA